MLAADTDPSSLAGLEIVDRRGERIGRVRQVYLDGDAIGWAGVRGNLFGTEEALVPLDGAVLDEDVIGVPVSRSRFHFAPRRRPDAALDEPEREHLRRFWAEPVAEPIAVVADEPGAATAVAVPEEEGVMTASEERLHVATERVPRMRVRLKKVVVTEQRTVTVPVRREEYRLVREPIDDARPVPGAVIGEAEQEVVLYEERVVVTTEVVPVERIRLVKEEVVDSREVVGDVRRERIELVDDGAEVEVAAVEPELVDEADEPDEPIDAEVVEPARELAAPQAPEAPAMVTKASTSRRSPRRPASTPARSSTSEAATAPPSTGASD